MKLFITSDTNWETRVDKSLDTISGEAKFFQLKNYGSSLADISIFIICRDPKLKFNQRIKFFKEEKKLYTDIMLNYDDMIKEKDDQKRLEIISKQIQRELPGIIEKFKLEDFNQGKFFKDLETFLVNS